MTMNLYKQVLDWYINDITATKSDHKMIEFKIIIDYLELIESFFNALFNLKKINWKLFQEVLEIEESITSLLIIKLDSTD